MDLDWTGSFQLNPFHTLVPTDFEENETKAPTYGPNPSCLTAFSSQLVAETVAK